MFLPPNSPKIIRFRLNILNYSWQMKTFPIHLFISFFEETTDSLLWVLPDPIDWVIKSLNYFLIPTTISIHLIIDLNQLMNQKRNQGSI